MPHIGNIDITEGVSGSCGAAFQTKEPIAAAFERHTARGSVRAEAAGRWVVVRLDTSRSEDEIRNDALALAEETLDVMLARHELLVALDAPMYDHIEWRSNADGLHLCCTHIAQFNAPRLPFRVTMDTPQHGPRKPTAWYPFLRFMRMAYCTSDPIDRFRYLYLAVENAASMLAPYDKKTYGSESKWLTLVLRGVPVDWQRVLESPTSRLIDPVDIVVSTLYQGTRLPTFHAKADGRDILLPADPEAAGTAVAAAALCHRVLQVLSAQLDYPVVRSAIFSSAYHTLMDQGHGDAIIQVSELNAPFSSGEIPPIGDERHPVTAFACRPGSRQRFVWTRIADADNPERPFSRIGLVSGETTLMAYGYDTSIDPRGASRLSLVVGGQMWQRGVA